MVKKLRRLIRFKRRDIQMSGWFLLVSLLLAGSIWWAWWHYISTPPYVDETRFPVRGIDISAHNGYANMKAVADAGYKFVMIKASEGTSFRDENFVLNYQKANHAGLKVGAYHFFRFDGDGVEQALNLLRAVGPRPLDLGLIIDVEQQGNPTNVPKDSVTFRLQQMVEFLNMKGHRVMLYSNRDGYEKHLYDDFRGLPLWICSFNEENADRDDWTFWQYDHHGKVPGIRGDVDLNAFCGSSAEFERLSSPSDSKTATPF